MAEADDMDERGVAVEGIAAVGTGGRLAVAAARVVVGAAGGYSGPHAGSAIRLARMVKNSNREGIFIPGDRGAAPSLRPRRLFYGQIHGIECEDGCIGRA